jgi:hypothetical protein
MSALARKLWRVTEPFHQLAYRSPEAVAAYEAIGLQAAPHQYFASRIAAAGEVTHGVAVAMLFGFAPDYVAQAIPDVWNIVDPKTVVNARTQGADATLRRILGAAWNSSEIERANSIAQDMIRQISFAGKPLAAAQSDVSQPDTAGLQLWRACTILREYRGDAHWAATAAAGIDAVECHILHAADGAMPEDLLQRVTGWRDAQWEEAKERLRSRGLLQIGDAKLALTVAGEEVKLFIERSTDSGSSSPVLAVGDKRTTELTQLMKPWIVAIMDADVIGAWKMREQLWRDLPEEKNV